MSDQMMTRRLLIKRGSQFSAAVAMTLSLAACGKGGSAGGKLVCNDPAKDSANTKEMRASYHYVDSFPDAEKTCSNCAFFVPSDDQGKCGTCKVLLGTANVTGHCDSFSAKT